jgi:competence protein ComEC
MGLRARQLLREQAVVTLALTPLSLLLFGQVSVVGLVANLLAIPWITLVVTPLALAGRAPAGPVGLRRLDTGPAGARAGMARQPAVCHGVDGAAPLWAGVAG